VVRAAARRADRTGPPGPPAVRPARGDPRARGAARDVRPHGGGRGHRGHEGARRGVRPRCGEGGRR
jgi:hypothetical protein